MSSAHLTRLRAEEFEARTMLDASLVLDINPGTNNSLLAPTPMENANGTLFFRANDGTSGYELWKSDGTAPGTVLVKDVNPGTAGGYPNEIVNVNGVVYFDASDGTSGYELWKSDGTAAGTVLVKDINPGSGNSQPTDLTAVGGTLFFSARGPEGVELWKSDGTAAGTVLVKDIRTGDSYPTNLTNVGGVLFFSIFDSPGDGQQLWKSDGTAAGTVLVKTIGQTPYGPRYLTNLNGTLFFNATDATRGSELWKSDGTAAGTDVVKDINATGSGGSNPAELVVANNTLFFTANDGTSGPELWRSDGTAAGTVLVLDIAAGPDPSFPGELTEVNGVVYFAATQDFFTTSTFGLWKSDGTAAGTVIVQGPFGKNSSASPRHLTNVGGTLFFNGNDLATGAELWQSDGTTAGTVIHQDIRAGAGGSSPNSLVNVGGKLYFSANDGQRGDELWAATPGVAPDTAGAKVSTAAFTGTGANTFDRVRLTFTEAVQPGTVNTTNVTVGGPGGAITVVGINPLPGSNNTRFDVAFATQSAPGTYTVTVGVGVLDVAGNQLDQNGNGTNGEAADQFSATGTIVAPPPGAAFAVGAADGTVRLLTADGTAVGGTLRPLDGATPYTGLVEVAMGDLDNDGSPDLFVSAANPSGVAGLDPAKAGRVFVFDGVDVELGKLTLIRTFTPFATTDGPAGNTLPYTNGLNIAVGDVNGDGTVDLVAGTRGGNGTPTGGNREVGRLVAIDGSTAAGVNTIIGGVQKPFGGGYEKGVIVAAGNADGTGGDEVAVTRGGPVASTNPAVQQIKLKVFQLRAGLLAELPLNADGTTSFAPFAALAGPANAIRRDGRVAFVDQDGDGKSELVFSALDPLTNAANGQVRVGVFSVSTAAAAGAASVLSTGTDAGTYVTGTAVADHAIARVAGTGTLQNLALLTQSAASGVAYLAPLTGAALTGGFSLNVLTGGIVIDAL